PPATQAEVLGVEPGEVIDLAAPETSALPEESRREGAGRVCLQGEGEVSAREYPARALPVRHHPGFEVPALAPGRYFAWYEYPDATGPRTTLDVTPPLKSKHPVARGAGVGATASVVVEVPGPTDADVTLTPKKSKAQGAGGGGDVAGGGAVADDEDVEVARAARSQGGEAVFEVVIKKCGRAHYVASAPGYKPASVVVDCLYPERKGPVPVVFVPATAASSLNLPDGVPYWLARNTLMPETLPKGILGDDSSAPGEAITVGGVIDEARLRLDSTMEYRLGRLAANAKLGFTLGCIPCADTLTNVACEVVAPDTPKCSALFYPLYKDFIPWAEMNFTTGVSSSSTAAPAAAPAPASPKTLSPAAYDWRKGVAVSNSEMLDEKVEAALGQAPGHDQVILLAHSLGGLVSREYIVGLGRGKVAALIAVGTPWLGSPKTARALLWGYDFEIGKYVRLNGRTKIIDPTTSAQTKVDNSLIFSLLDLKETRRAARTWPAVFIQLPTLDFMRLLGDGCDAECRGREEKSGDAANAAKERAVSVVWKWTPKETVDFFREQWTVKAKDEEGVAFESFGNRKLFDQTEAWRRSRTFRRNDYGVTHHLFAGFGDLGGCGDAEMDMQMTEPRDTIERGFKTKILRGLGINVLKTIASTLRQLDVFTTDYYATLHGCRWGDGTAPLLSATLGAHPRGDARRDRFNPDATQQFLGEDTHVYVRELSPGFMHSTMLDDPKLRWEVWRVYRRENQRLGIVLNPPVRSIVVELNRKNKNGVEDLRWELAGHALRQVSPPIMVKVKGGYFFRYEFVAHGMGAADDAQVPPGIEQLFGQPLKLTNVGKGSIRILRVRLLVNGMEVVNHQVEKKLTKSDPSY
ncbi:MAG TPA: alpha/beta hydrolase, partial [Pyrinomonadaceae bacterium]|nr:alpha/beta hydrolase [Pyrinomonadaceae bacterium]